MYYAAKCYVYLSDLSTTWESAFRASRWFKRGWTLQELLAPTSVAFFSREGKPLGNKRTLEHHVHEITGIAISGLQGSLLSKFSVTERMSWPESRQTTREEDSAYSLLGIFDVYMSLIYGEGRENALKRLLHEIDKPVNDERIYVLISSTAKGGLTSELGLDFLPFATDAPFNVLDRQDDLTCLPNTRVDLL